MDWRGRRGAAASEPAVSEQRARAHQAAIDAWRSAGWPARAPTAAEDVQIKRCLCKYLEASFPGKLSAAEALEIVLEGLQAFIPLLLVRPTRTYNTQPGAGDLLEWLTNASLEKLAGRRPACPEHPQFTQPSSVTQDEALTDSLLGADPDAVRAGLRTLVADGLTVDFLIITQYLDLGEVAPSRPPRPSQVANELMSHRLLVGVQVTESDVSSVLLRFRDRLVRVAS